MSELKIVKNKKEVRELIRHCKTTGYCSFDFETTSLKFYEETELPLCVGISFQPGSSWVVPLAHSESPFLKSGKWKNIFRLLGRELLEDWDVVKVAWNFKFEYKWCKRFGITPRGRLFDAQLAKYTLDEERPNDLKSWVMKLFPQYAKYEKNIKDGDRKWKDIPLQELSTYCGIDSDLTLRLMIFFEQRMIKLGFYNLFRNLLMMSMRVLAESEYEGIPINRPYLQELATKYTALISKCDKELRSASAVRKYELKRRSQYINGLIKKVKLEIEKIIEDDPPNAARLIANREQKIVNYRSGVFSKKEQEFLDAGLNWGSPNQIRDFLFHSKYGLRLKPLKQTESGADSTDEETILALKDKDTTGTLERLLEYRGLTKLDSTYITGMIKNLSSQDKVHANFKIFGTVTGRLSCAEPNLQNIPRGTTASDIKKMFLPPPGYVLLEVDYSQAELRVVAELAKDKAMIDIFKRGYNIHVATACLINGGIGLYDKVREIIKNEKHPDWLFWEKQKKRAKTINFGILYGQTEKKLSIELECSEKKAKKFIQQWYEAYPEVAKWIDRQKKYVRKHGYVYNLFGRKRRLYNIYHEKYGVRLEAERQAVNTPIQGTASDFTLLSQVVIRDLKMKGELPKDMQQLYTVHDSIGFAVKPTDIHSVVPKLIKICDNPDTMKWFGFKLEHVTMKVAVEAGPNWYDKHDYNPWTDYSKLTA